MNTIHQQAHAEFTDDGILVLLPDNDVIMAATPEQALAKVRRQDAKTAKPLTDTLIITELTWHNCPAGFVPPSMSETRTGKFPAFRVHRNAIVRINRRRWRVQSVELVAVYRKGERQEPRLRFRLSDGAGHHMNVTKEQFDLMTLEVRS